MKGKIFIITKVRS